MGHAERLSGRLGDVRGFIAGPYGGDLHSERVDAPAGTTLGVMIGASLAVAVIGQALARARGPVTEHMLPLLRQGGARRITATSNLVSADLAFIFRNHADPARAAAVEAARARVIAARTRVSRSAQIASIKALVAQRTGNPDWALVRPPLLPPTADERAALGA